MYSDMVADVVFKLLNEAFVFLWRLKLTVVRDRLVEGSRVLLLPLLLLHFEIH